MAGPKLRLEALRERAKNGSGRSQSAHEYTSTKARHMIGPIPSGSSSAIRGHCRLQKGERIFMFPYCMPFALCVELNGHCNRMTNHTLGKR